MLTRSRDFFNIPVDNLFAAKSPVTGTFRRDLAATPVIVAPDAGGVERAPRLCQASQWRSRYHRPALRR